MKIYKTKNWDKARDYIWDYKGKDGKKALNTLAPGSFISIHGVVRVVFHSNTIKILADEDGTFVEHDITLFDKED